MRMSTVGKEQCMKAPDSYAYTRNCYPIGSAFTPVPQFFVRVPRFFPAFVLLRCSPPWSSSPTDHVRFVCGTSPSPDVVEKRCGCTLSSCVASFPCAVTALTVRRVYQVMAQHINGRGRQGREAARWEKGRTRCAASCLFRALTFASLASPLPPPPAVSSTLIRRPSSSDWCKRSAACNGGRAENSRNAQPLDLATVAPARVTFGVSRRTVGGGSELGDRVGVYGMDRRGSMERWKVGERTHRTGRSGSELLRGLWCT
jgi:hypothetical protein